MSRVINLDPSDCVKACEVDLMYLQSTHSGFRNIASSDIFCSHLCRPWRRAGRGPRCRPSPPRGTRRPWWCRARRGSPPAPYHSSCRSQHRGHEGWSSGQPQFSLCDPHIKTTGRRDFVCLQVLPDFINILLTFWHFMNYPYLPPIDPKKRPQRLPRPELHTVTLVTCYRE